MLFGSRSPLATMLRELRRAHDVLVSFAGTLPPELETALAERRLEGGRTEVFAQRPFEIEAIGRLLAEGFLAHPQEPASAEVVILDRHAHYALRTGEPLPNESALTCSLLTMRGQEMVVITGRVRRCDDHAGILILEELEHFTFDVRCRLSVVRGQWVRVLGARSLSPFAPTYLPHTVQALEVAPLRRRAEGGAPAHAILAEEVPPPVLERWEAMLRDRGFLDLWDVAGYLQQHRIHPEAALQTAAPGAGRLVGWALTAAAALALQLDSADLPAVKAEIERSLGCLVELAAGAADVSAGLTPPALEAVMDALSREVVTAVLRQDQPHPTGLSARTGA